MDLSQQHDLTACCLVGRYKNVDIIIPHSFFPIVKAREKAEDDGIPIYGWSDDGELTMCNTPIVNYDDVVEWFLKIAVTSSCAGTKGVTCWCSSVPFLRLPSPLPLLARTFTSLGR